ncbi:uncharacterized protein TrAtP1_003092 [Trichoderma atroviride]|uniref:uncharacterized protein n=1 Tax=Hypocrea atroviridis TaxID=63577 RepID=UPI003327A58C|nr:hypothetical protein TrAtP1_003092 [Trichoderma atroviride]
MTTKWDKRRLFAMQRYDFKELVLAAWWADQLPANTAPASAEFSRRCLLKLSTLKRSGVGQSSPVMARFGELATDKQPIVSSKARQTTTWTVKLPWWLLLWGI